MLRRRQPRLYRKSSRGVALIAVLGLLSVLFLLALSVLDTTRRHGQMLRNSMDAQQARELADSALRLAIWSQGQANAGPVTQALSYDVFGQAVQVTAQLEAGRVDLNSADRDLLTAVFAANGFDESQARSLAARIIDWRDVDDAATLDGGAERAEYAGLKRGGPRNGLFETITELQSVIGCEQLSGELLDSFTVYSQGQSVRQRYAPPSVDRALRWAHDRRLGGREWYTREAGATVDDTTAATDVVVRYHACATSGQIESCRGAVTRLTGNASEPNLVYAWWSEPAE